MTGSKQLALAFLITVNLCGVMLLIGSRAHRMDGEVRWRARAIGMLLVATATPLVFWKFPGLPDPVDDEEVDEGAEAGEIGAAT